MFGVFDRVEESLINDSLACGRDRRQQARGGFNVRPGNDSSPGLRPMLSRRLDLSFGDSVEEGCLIQQRVADTGVAPVEQVQAARRAAKVARVKVAVNKPVRDATGSDRCKPGREARDELFKQVMHAGSEFIRAACQQCTDG